MKHMLVGAIAVLIVAVGFLTIPSTAQAQGAMVNSLFWFEQPNQSAALLDLESGAMDIYMFQLRTAADIAAAKANPNLYTIDTGGSYNDIYVNPIPVNQSLPGAAGKINPFEKQPVREALHYLINREFITRQVALGQFPMYMMQERASAEYARDAAYFADVERRYAFNPTLARQMIADALNADPRYSFVNGQWMAFGNPVTLGFVIRTEDIRRNIGDYIAGQLEEYGFAVNRIYRTGGGAFAIVYTGAPDTGAWHLYTEGWAATALVAWEDGDPHFFYGGGSGDRVEALFGCELQATKPDPTYCDADLRLFESRYTTLAERRALYRIAIDGAMKQATRVFVTNGATFAISNRVTGFVYDLSGGPWGFLSPRTARFATAGVGDMKMGQRIHFLSPWSPWRGFSWLYDGLQANAFTENALWPHPHTGLYMPIRAAFAVTTQGPTGTLAVPATASKWDPTTKALTATVGAGVTATTKVVFTWTFGKWHDGSTFDMDDVLYDYALMFRRANATAGDIYAEDSQAASAGIVLLTRLIKGIEVVSPTQMAVYLDYWHIDPSTIAATAMSGGQYTVGPIIPWTAAELSLSTVLNNGPCSVDEGTASAKGKVALDLTKGDCLVAMDQRIAALQAARHRPPGFDATTLPDAEVDAEWSALWAFRNTTQHFMPSNGPFVLSNVDVAALQTSMTRWADYPIPASTYDGLLRPRIPEVSFGTAPTVLIGRQTDFALRVALPGGAPYDAVTMSWLLVDPATGQVLSQGSPTRLDAGSYQVRLTATQTATLRPAAYELRTITVGDEAAVPVFANQAFIAIPDVETIVALQNARITQLENELDQKTAQLANTTTSLTNAVNAANTSATIGLGVGAAGVIAGIVGIALGARAGRKRAEEKPPEQM